MATAPASPDAPRALRRADRSESNPMLRTGTTLLLLAVALGSLGCDNVGRAFDRDLDGTDPTPTPGESTIQAVPAGGDAREGRPKVKAALPADGGWPTSVPIVVEFTESINESSILPSTPTGTDARVILRVSGTTTALPCQYDFVAGGRVLVMRPVTELSNAQTPTYEVVMLPGGRDVDGLRFTVAEGGVVLTSFQVNQDPSFVDGRILTTYPRDNARDVPRETEYLVVFDRPANQGSIQATNLRVRPRGGADLPGERDLPLEVVGIQDPRVVRFVPDDPLVGAAAHELVVDDTITFGTSGVLDFRGRTPFATFDTVATAAPADVAVGNTMGGFPNKVNRTNLATVVVEVTTAADAQPGDRIRARIYGGDAGTQATGDVAFVEATEVVPAPGSQVVTIDFSDRLGTLTNPKFDDGELTVAAQTQRGSVQSGFTRNPDDDAPVFDITPPSLVSAGPPNAANGADILTDLESLAFFGRASEEIAEASLADGVNPAADLFASAPDGRFVMKPLFLGRLQAPRNYVLTLTDLAGNLATSAANGRIVQRGLQTGSFAGDLTVEVVDDATLLPIANAIVLVDPATPTVPASGQLTAATASNGRATFSGLVAAPHTITVVRAGFHVHTLLASGAGFVSIELRPTANATSTFAGTALFTPTPSTTVMVGTSGFDDPLQMDVRTTSAAPTTIPSAAILPNRPTVVTAFGGAFEPTAVPTFSLQGVQMLGPTLTTPAPPLQAGAGGAPTTAALTLIPAAGSLAGLLGTYEVDFGLATGLDTSNLVGAPTVRVLAQMDGFSRQVLTGVGFATATMGAAFRINANFSFPAFVGLMPFIPNQAGLIAVTARDQAGRVSRHRAGLLAVTGTVLNPTPVPIAIPTITTPSGPSTGSPAVTFEDVLDGVTSLALYDVTAVDGAGRRWNVLLADIDVAGGTKTVQFPDPTAAGLPALATGTWTVTVEGRLFASLGATADDVVFRERVRGEVSYARSASVAFTVQ